MGSEGFSARRVFLEKIRDYPWEKVYGFMVQLFILLWLSFWAICCWLAAQLLAPLILGQLTGPNEAIIVEGIIVLGIMSMTALLALYRKALSLSTEKV